MERSEYQTIVTTFGELQQVHVQLQTENDRLRLRLDKEVLQNQESKELVAHLTEHVSHSTGALARKQAQLETYVGMLAVYADSSGAKADSERLLDALAAANGRITLLTQKLELCYEERNATRETLGAVSTLHADQAKLEQELFVAEGKLEHSADMTQAHATTDMWKRRYQETRELLGKSEIDAKRKESEYQLQLSSMSRQLQQGKATLERVFKEAKEAKQHAQQQHRPAASPTLLQPGRRPSLAYQVQQQQAQPHHYQQQQQRQQPMGQMMYQQQLERAPPQQEPQERDHPNSYNFDMPAWGGGGSSRSNAFMPSSYAREQQQRFGHNK